MGKGPLVIDVIRDKGYPAKFVVLKGGYSASLFCKEELSIIIGSPVKPGMKLALVDLAEYDVEGLRNG